MEHHLNETLQNLKGPSKEQITVFNQWAARALDNFHSGSKADVTFILDGISSIVSLKWDSNFSKDAMNEKKKIAEEGGVSLAFFVMSVLLGYHYVQQTEIGTGVDYRFSEAIPDPLNFLGNSHFIEISAILEEGLTNTLKKRIVQKHKQINKGLRKNEESSVIVTLFTNPITVKETHARI